MSFFVDLNSTEKMLLFASRVLDTGQKFLFSTKIFFSSLSLSLLRVQKKLTRWNEQVHRKGTLAKLEIRFGSKLSDCRCSFRATKEVRRMEARIFHDFETRNITKKESKNR